MALPTFTMRQLLEAGVHFGHQTRRWNPKMEPYIFGVRNGIHIIDLEQTVPLLHQALGAVRDVVANGGRVLFVATKRQASDRIAELAKRCGQYYVNHRWLGGTLTNWTGISASIRHLNSLDEQLADENLGFTKKETLRLTRQRNKLERSLGGIKEMGGIPDIMVVIDTNREEIAVREANKLSIPVVAVLDSNSDPSRVAYPVPGNDDAMRAIKLYCDLFAAAALDGIQQELEASGADAGEVEEPPSEDLPGAAEEKAHQAAPAATEPQPPAATEPEPPAATEPEPPAATEPEPPAATEPEPPAATESEPPAEAGLEEKPAEQPVPEEKAAEEPVSEEKPAEGPVSEEKPAEQPVSEEKPAEQPVSEEKAEPSGETRQET